MARSCRTRPSSATSATLPRRRVVGHSEFRLGVHHGGSIIRARVLVGGLGLDVVVAVALALAQPHLPWSEVALSLYMMIVSPISVAI